jgi:Mn-dependent DtxR family transcriptional regulator
LGVSRPSVHRTLSLLADLGLIVKQPRKSIWLSPLGAELVQEYHENYALLQQRLTTELQLPLFDAEEIASLLVGSLDPIYVERLCQALEPSKK